jgi:hypothetical protein
VKTYEQFWRELAPAYPVSKGEMRVPIVTTLQTLPGVDMSQVLQNLQTLLEDMLENPAITSSAVERAVAAGESDLAPLITTDYTGVVRFDCVLDAAGAVKVLELNADYPDGLLLHDATYRTLTNTPCSLHTDAYLQFFAEQTNIHISHPPEAGFLDAYYVEKLALEASGHVVSIGATPSSDATVWHRRCTEVSKMSSAELQSWSGLQAQHINSFALRTLGYKDLLASGTHPYVPRTLLLDPRHLSEVIASRAQWVLKPANGCEGQGIYFGKDYTDDGWQTLVGQLSTGYIAQEFVTLPQRTVSIYMNEGIEERHLFYDFCPHFFIQSGKVVGSGHVLMRFSQSPVVNVSQGGAIGYHQVTSTQ